MSELYQNIMGEPEVLADVLNNRKKYFGALAEKYRDAERIYVVGSGTSFHCGLSVRRFMEQLTGLEVTAAYPSVFMEGTVLHAGKALCVGISQSGRSAVTVKALERCRKAGFYTAAVSSNNPSAIAEAAEDFIPLIVGIERSASTKGYVTSMLTLILLALEIGLRNGHASEADERRIVALFERHIEKFPEMVKICEDWIARNEADFLKMVRVSVMGYEVNYGTALEGALKLLEAVRVMVAGYDFEEWLHGAYNALSEESFLFICRHAGHGDYAGRVAKLQRIVSPFTPHVYVVGGEDDGDPRNVCLPVSGEEILAPFEFILPFQMMIALLPEKKGINADRLLIPNFHTELGSKSVK